MLVHGRLNQGTGEQPLNIRDLPVGIFVREADNDDAGATHCLQ